jgi:hypothetical protein
LTHRTTDAGDIIGGPITEPGAPFQTLQLVEGSAAHQALLSIQSMQNTPLAKRIQLPNWLPEQNQEIERKNKNKIWKKNIKKSQTTRLDDSTTACFALRTTGRAIVVRNPQSPFVMLA